MASPLRPVPALRFRHQAGSTPAGELQVSTAPRARYARLVFRYGLHRGSKNTKIDSCLHGRTYRRKMIEDTIDCARLAPTATKTVGAPEGYKLISLLSVAHPPRSPSRTSGVLDWERF